MFFDTIELRQEGGGRRKEGGREEEGEGEGYDREGQRREREGVETGRGGIGREGKDAYAESSSARRATFIGAWMYDGVSDAGTGGARKG